MDPNKTFVKKTTSVEAVQFQGWADVIALLEWMKSPAYFVPAGFDHQFRSGADYDVNGIRTDAPNVLVVLTPTGWARANSGDWIVKEDNKFWPYSPEEFSAAYDKKDV